MASTSLLKRVLCCWFMLPRVWSCEAFPLEPPTKTTHAVPSCGTPDRRAFVWGLATSLLLPISPASATYSAFKNREMDWEQRKAKGEIQFSTARQLRSQLRELVPQNDESSKIFCPNGTPSNVSPLMENKCGDRLAMPSVYGRRDDVVGNSIPGRTSRGTL